MAGKALSEADIAEAVRLVAEHGNTAAASRASGIPYSTLERRYKNGRAAIDPAIKASMGAVGTLMVPSLVWGKTAKPDENGMTYSVLMKPAADDMGQSIRDALDDIPAIAAIPAPVHADDDLLTVYPLADVHLGMMSWGKETGEDYDTKIASTRVQSWIAQTAQASPNSGTAILLDVGDLTHADDQTNQTPRSKHQLDTDTRHFKTTQSAITTLALAVETLARKHARVIVRILPGNHNPTAYMAIMFALGQRYRDNPRVEVQEEPGEFFVFEFGEVMIAAHHGDKATAQRLINFLADEYAPIWGRTRHRYLWTGHLHHHKSQDIGGVTWEQLRAVASRDAYAVSHAYSARAQLQAITLHRTDGETQRVKIGANSRCAA